MRNVTGVKGKSGRALVEKLAIFGRTSVRGGNSNVTTLGRLNVSQEVVFVRCIFVLLSWPPTNVCSYLSCKDSFMRDILSLIEELDC